jgi:flagellar P-ring protein precursor FlgI
MFIQQARFQKLNYLTQKKLFTKCFLGKIIWLVLFVTLINSPLANAERIKELASIQGVRQNQLIGYGIVVGLDGTGDQSPVTVQGITNMLTQMGINTPAGANLQAKNVAGVVVTANLPSFAQPGQTLDITVSSVGAAKSLRGGTLLMTPLKGADGQVYAMAQGNLLVGGAGAAAAGASTTVNHLSAGRISAGATVERAVNMVIGEGNMIALELKDADFSTAASVVSEVNKKFGDGTASAKNSRVINVRAPIDYDQRVAFLGELESVRVKTKPQAAKVVLNGRTGSIVMNQAVTLKPCAISHGNLSVVVTANNEVSQPGALSSGETVGVTNAQVSIESKPGLVVTLPNSALLSDVVNALNSIGATPQDLLAILQAIKVSGSLNAELEII